MVLKALSTTSYIKMVPLNCIFKMENQNVQYIVPLHKKDTQNFACTVVFFFVCLFVLFFGGHLLPDLFLFNFMGFLLLFFSCIL